MATSPLTREPDVDRDERALQEDRVPASVAEVPPSDGNDTHPTVRFSSKNEEIGPEHSLHTTDTMPEDQAHEPLSAEQQEELRNLSKSMQSQNSALQHRRMSNFVFEPVSLPASRVPSSEGTSRHGSVVSKLNQMGQTAPLTPAGSGSRDQLKSPTDARIAEMTPQSSGPQASSGTTSASTRPTTAESTSTKPTLTTDEPGKMEPPHRQVPIFTTPGVDSPSPGSRDQSPNRSAKRQSAAPIGDEDDRYARSKRPPPGKGEGIDSRFVFDNRRHSSIHSGQASPVPRSDSTEAGKHDRQGSTAHHRGSGAGVDDQGGHRGSVMDLKRFFHFGHHHHKKSKDSTASARAAAGKSTGTRTPPHQAPGQNVPFADDHGLESKYGKFGKVLGSGAGGSVRLLKRPSDGVTFAVKQFRERHNYESEKEYAKKVTAEFCIGSTLHHGNIIETMDLIQERGNWYVVMEYAPFDLFAIVMTGKMSREEVACSFAQIFAGVTYLHGMGLAHRDLKLDNVVVNEHGIMKLIDFGSAIVYRYPFEKDVVLASGCVGSDPYLAPEVYDSHKYDPRPTDVWSLAIIYACMSLRRFPWKAPRMSDNSFRLFASPPTPGTPPAENASRQASRLNVSDANDDAKSTHSSRHTHTHESTKSAAADGARSDISTLKGSEARAAQSSESVKGPWRLLRLLPRESRNIMSAMLEIDPNKRATMEKMLEDPWIANIPVCRQIDHGEVIKATGHKHTLEPGASPDGAAAVKK